VTIKTLIFLASLCMGASAAAHPHVFVDARAGFTFDAEGRLIALRITWTYDAFSSLLLFDILDLDQDGDGLLNEADLAAIVDGETVWADDYAGDTYLEQNDAPIALTRPQNGSASMADNRISVSFDLPLAAPMAVSETVTLLLYDPNYYYAYAVEGLEAAMPDACTAELIAFEPDTATSELQAQLARLSREETPDIENVGRLFADQIYLTC